MDVAGVLDLMRTHLGNDGLGPDDDFFAAGGDSLTGLALVGDAQERGLAVTLLDLADRPTARALAALAGRPDRPVGTGTAGGAGTTGGNGTAGGTGTTGGAGPTGGVGGGSARSAAPFALMDPMDRVTVPAGAIDVFPASALQVGIAYQCSRAGDPALYHDVADLPVAGRFDEDLFRQALAGLCRRHPALRTSLDLGGFSTAAQVLWDTVQVPLTVDTAGADPAEAAARARRWRDGQLAAGLAWTSAPAFACHVVAGDGAFHLAVATHHTLVDGWSFARLVVDLLTTYDALLGGRAPALRPPAPDATRDFVLLEQEAAASAAAAAYWLAQADHPALLPAAAGPARLVDASARCQFAVPADRVGRLRAAARSVGVPLKSLLLGAYIGALARWAGRREHVVTGVVTNARPETAGADRAVGLFLNTLPLHTAAVADSAGERARQAFSAEQRALPHRRHPLAAIERRLGRPAFDTAFNFTHFHVLDELRELRELRVGHWSSFDKTSFPLMVDVAVGFGDRADVRFTFDPGVVAPSRVDVLASHYERELRETEIPT